MPEWYFLPFYAILRSITFDIWFIPAKLIGVVAMFASIAILIVLPWLDRSKVRSARFRPIYKQFFWIFLFDCLVLGYVGANPAEGVLHPHRPGGDGLLFPAFPGHRAAARNLREAADAAGQHQCGGHQDRGREIGGLEMRKFLITAIASVLFASGSALAAEGVELPDQEWSFSGVFGHFDRDQLKRGFQVYREVCASCHARCRWSPTAISTRSG